MIPGSSKYCLAGAGALAVVCVASPVAAQDISESQELRRAVTVAGILEHQRAFQAIADASNDTRASGTHGYRRSADYVIRTLRDAGLRVSDQLFRYTRFVENAPAELEQTSPQAVTFEEGTDFATLEYSGAGDVTGALRATNDVQIPPPAQPGSTSGCEAGDFPAPPPGLAIALIQRGTCTFRQKVDNAAAAGYDAAIIFNEGQAGRTDVVSGTLSEPQAAIPAIGATFALGEDLYGQLQTGAVSVRVAVDASAVRSLSRNVLAETPRGRGDRVIVVGAHLDSVPEGPGINDNGSGTSVIMEIAEQLQELGIRPRNKVRFAFWGAEESGLIGSTHYVESLSPRALRTIALNLNFDMLGSPNFARLVYDGDGSAFGTEGPAGSDTIEREFLRYFRARGLATEPTAFDGRSDYFAFIEAGIPAGGLFSGAEEIKTRAQARKFGGRAGIAFDRCYHQACDDIGNLSRRALDQLGDGAVHAVLHFAQARSPVAVATAAAGAAAQAVNLYRGPHLVR